MDSTDRNRQSGAGHQWPEAVARDEREERDFGDGNHGVPAFDAARPSDPNQPYDIMNDARRARTDQKLTPGEGQRAAPCGIESTTPSGISSPPASEDDLLARLAEILVDEYEFRQQQKRSHIHKGLEQGAGRGGQ